MFRGGADIIRLPKTDTVDDVLEMEQEIAAIENKIGSKKKTMMLAAIESALGVVNAVDIAYGRVNVKLGDASVHHLTSFLISSGFIVSGIVPQRRSLQDFFLKVLKR